MTIIMFMSNQNEGNSAISSLSSTPCIKATNFGKVYWSQETLKEKQNKTQQNKTKQDR